MKESSKSILFCLGIVVFCIALFGPLLLVSRERDAKNQKAIEKSKFKDGQLVLLADEFKCRISKIGHDGIWVVILNNGKDVLVSEDQLQPYVRPAESVK